MAQFLSYGKQSIDDDDIRAVLETLKSDFLTQGPAVSQFEQVICDYTGAKYCVAVANGTAALHIAVAALNIPSGYEGITSPNTFAASSNALLYNGLTPVFADIDSRTYNIDTQEIRKRITEKTKLLIPVHFAGQPAEMPVISGLAREKELYVIEDAAHAIGSVYADGSKVGCCKYAELTTFSFHPVKTITTGEGGAITTNDQELYERLLLLRNHGITKDAQKLSQAPGPWYYEMQELGFNYRLTDIQAVLGMSQIRKLEKFKSRRREIVKRYNQAFADIDWLTIPYERSGLDSCFHLYVILIDFEKIDKNRSVVMKELKQKNIGTQVHYIPVHTHPYYQKQCGCKWGDYPAAESYYQKALSLPLFPELTDGDVEYVIDTIKALF